MPETVTNLANAPSTFGQLMGATSEAARAQVAGNSNSAFTRVGEPMVMSVSPTTGGTAIAVTVPDMATAFRIINPNPFYVRLRGYGSITDFTPITDGLGWLWGPGQCEILGTRRPAFVAVIAVARPGVPILDGSGNFLYPGATIEMQYGGGL